MAFQFTPVFRLKSNRENQSRNGSQRPEGSSDNSLEQSLTKDLSKAFVCNVCDRRFRCEEYFHRHRAIMCHEHDEMYSHSDNWKQHCNNCGKTFSRLDLWKKHRHTQCSGAIVTTSRNGGDRGNPEYIWVPWVPEDGAAA